MVDEQKKPIGSNERKSMSDWVSERTPGRRDGDHYQCAMHEYITSKNEHCFDVIKEQIKEEVRRRDTKIDKLHERMGRFVTYTAAGLITSVAMALLGILLMIILSQLSDMIATDKETAKILNDVVVGQRIIVNQFERFTPEHELLMQHLRDVVTKKE